MASTSFRDSDVERLKNSATTIYNENQSVLTEIRKFITTMKEIAVDLEKENQSDKVKKFEDGVMELLESSDDCVHFNSVIEKIGEGYEYRDQLTDFKKLIEDEVIKLKNTSPSIPQNHPLLRQFKEAIWHVHHAGQPMPGEEQEDIVMTSTQSNILNVLCPLSGKAIVELEEPVRSMDCKHIYDKKSVMHYIHSKNLRGRCPMAGCPKMLRAERVICDPLLLIEIDEERARNKQTGQFTTVEDFTELDEDD